MPYTKPTERYLTFHEAGEVEKKYKRLLKETEARQQTIAKRRISK